MRPMQKSCVLVNAVARVPTNMFAVRNWPHPNHTPFIMHIEFGQEVTVNLHTDELMHSCDYFYL